MTPVLVPALPKKRKEIPYLSFNPPKCHFPCEYYYYYYSSHYYCCYEPPNC